MTEKINFGAVEEDSKEFEIVMKVKENETEVKIVPKYGSPEWSDYVLSLLTDDEKPKGNPTCAGLRRIVEDLLGEIVDTGPINFTSLVDAQGKMRATVLYRVVFAWKMDVPEYIDMTKFEYPTKEFREVGEAWPGNTPAPFDVHAAATASSRAEGRALRKALKLKVATAEEMNTGGTDSGIIDTSDKATSFQKTMIKGKCDALSINIDKFIGVQLDSLSHKDATKFLEQLIKFTLDSTKIPQEIKL